LASEWRRHRIRRGNGIVHTATRSARHAGQRERVAEPRPVIQLSRLPRSAPVAKGHATGQDGTPGDRDTHRRPGAGLVGRPGSRHRALCRRGAKLLHSHLQSHAHLLDGRIPRPSCAGGSSCPNGPRAHGLLQRAGLFRQGSRSRSWKNWRMRRATCFEGSRISNSRNGSARPGSMRC
jgi:hypothetical protein